jgi:hypothetical protein
MLIKLIIETPLQPHEESERSYFISAQHKNEFISSGIFSINPSPQAAFR